MTKKSLSEVNLRPVFEYIEEYKRRREQEEQEELRFIETHPGYIRQRFARLLAQEIREQENRSRRRGRP